MCFTEGALSNLGGEKLREGELRREVEAGLCIIILIVSCHAVHKSEVTESQVTSTEESDEQESSSSESSDDSAPSSDRNSTLLERNNT